ncbi:hypothetical protein [Phenylobacterium sp.]|uniref:hypothetical protein n=1 Tax=Phenylobacterium sp. TaxID=1871053 RepID=UPI0025E112AC|nr:hypothetical protein [Phenylobacterium sp.]
MHFMLSAMGQELAWSGEAGVVGHLDDALREAEAILERDPACEGVEIFAGGRFIHHVERRLI